MRLAGLFDGPGAGGSRALVGRMLEVSRSVPAWETHAEAAGQ
jgi:hypothetical protein